jgi:hypothetical protein
MLRTLGVGILTATVTVVQTPSLSGSWTVDYQAPQCRGGAGAAGIGAGCSDGGGAKVICGATISIDVTKDAIKVERPLNGQTLKLTFPLDGSPVRHPVPLCRNITASTDPARARLMEQDMEKYRSTVEPGSDDMTTRATREGIEIVLRSTNSTARRLDGRPPYMVIEQTQRLSLSALGHLLVDTDRTATEVTAGVVKTKLRLAYARTKVKTPN